MLSLIRLNLLKLLRSWRWRIFNALVLVLVYWLGRSALLKTGGAVWFAGKEPGFLLVQAIIALALIISTVDIVHEVEKKEIRKIYSCSLCSPIKWILTTVISVFLAYLPVMLVAIFWSPLGAYRGGFEVLFAPNIIITILYWIPFLFTVSALSLLFTVLLRSYATSILLSLITTTSLYIYQALYAQVYLILYEYHPITKSPIPFEVMFEDTIRLAAPGFLSLGLTLVSVDFRSMRNIRTLGVRPGSALILAGLLILTLNPVNLAQRKNFETLERKLFKSNNTFDQVTLKDRKGQLERRSYDLSRVIDNKVIDLEFTPERPAHSVQKWQFGIFSEGVRLGDAPASSSGVKYRLTPASDGLRQWQVALNPALIRFDRLGSWYGIGFDYDGNEEEVYTEIYLPQLAEGKTWICDGIIAASRSDSKGQVIKGYAVHPAALIGTQYTIEASKTYREMGVQFSFLGDRTRLNSAFHQVYGSAFERISRIIGGGNRPYVFYEVPLGNQFSDLALSTTLMDELDLLVDDLDNYENPTREKFLEKFSVFQNAILRKFFERHSHLYEDKFLFGESLIVYLNEHALGDTGRWNQRRNLRRDLYLLPATNYRDLDDYLAINPGEENYWNSSYNEENSLSNIAEVKTRRGVAFHHHLRYVIGDEEWSKTIWRLYNQEDDSPVINVKLYEEIATELSGKDLSSLFESWLEKGFIPSVEIVEGEATLLRNEEENTVKYITAVKLKNTSVESFVLPFVLLTEGGEVRDEIMMDPGEEYRVEYELENRPIFLEVDPVGWLPWRKDDQDQKKRRLQFRTIKQGEGN